MTNLLTRTYNSTLGIPQQILYRLFRAMKDEDIDVLSREGLLAPELLPVLGIGFSHESDATIEDIIGEQGFGTSLAADILLDPATYLTAGASALGKAGRGIQLASREKKFGQQFVDHVGELSQYKTGQDLAAHISQGIADGTLQGKGAKKALQGLQGASDETLEKILKSGRDEELLFSIPGLSRLGAQWRAPELIQQQGSWFKAMTNLFYKQKLGAAKPIDWTVAQAASVINRVPGGEGFNKAIATVAGLPGTFVKGFKSTKGATQTIQLGAEVGEDVYQWNDEFGVVGRAWAKVDAEQFQDDVAAAIAGGADAEKAAYTAAKKQNVGRIAVDALTEAYGASIDDIGGLLPDLQRQHQEVEAALDAGKARPKLTERYGIPEEYTGHPFLAWAWKSGDWAGEMVRKGFRSDTPIESDNIEKGFQRYKELTGLADVSARDTLRIFDTLKRRLSSDNGVDLETIDRFWFSWQQAFPHAQEVRANIAALRSGDLSAGQAAYRQLTEFVNRFDSSATSLHKHSGVQDLEDMLKVLDPGTAGRIVGPQAEHIKLMAADVTDPSAVKDLLRKPIGAMEPQDIKRLRAVAKDPKLKARLKNIERRRKKGKAVSVEESIERGMGKVRFGGKPLKEGPAAAMGEYLMATRDIRRALKVARKTGEPVRITPFTVARLEKAQDAMQGVLRETAGRVFKKSKPDDIDALIGLSDNVANQAAKLNGFERGAVIGYAPRIHNRKFRARYQKLIGKAQRRLGANDEVDAMFARVQERDLTIEDLNLLKEELIRADMPDLVDELTDVAGEFKERPYVESWEAGILTRMSQHGQQVAARDFVNEVFSSAEAAAKDGIIGGRVTRLIDSQGKTIGTGKDRVKIGGVESATVKREELAKELQPSAIEIQLPSGEYQVIDLRHYKDRFGDQGIQVLGTQGDDLGQALIRHEARSGGRYDGAAPEVGSWIIGGEGGVVDFLRQTGVPQKSEMAGAVAAYDAVNFAIKKFQTVFRVSHHAGNLLSGIAQTRAAGVSWGNTALGHMDAARVMGLAGAEGVKAIDDMSALSGSGATWNVFKRMGDRAKVVEGLIAGKTIDELGEFATIDFGLHAYGAGEIMQRATARNLFGGIQAVEDVKLGGFDPQGVLKEQEKLRAGKATRAVETALDASRAPEITARTATLFGLLREGHSLDDAIDLAKLAHVDYSSLTKFERNALKRAIPYYTFSRKYTPFALERLAKDPKLLVGWQKTVENADWAGIDENGTPVLSYGRFEMDLGRINANLDAMMALAGTTEMLRGTMGSEIQQVQRPGFASFSGGALSPLFATIGAGSEDGASVPQGLQEFWDSVFVTRWLEGVAQTVRGEGTQKIGDALTNYFIPARLNAEPDKARQFQLNTARRVLRRLELQAQEATSERQLASLRRQAQEIRNAIQTVQEDFGR